MNNYKLSKQRLDDSLETIKVTIPEMIYAKLVEHNVSNGEIPYDEWLVDIYLEGKNRPSKLFLAWGQALINGDEIVFENHYKD